MRQRDIQLLKIDIKKWGSPVAEQHKVKSIPQLLLYEGTKLVSADRGQVMAALGRRAEAQGAPSSSSPSTSKPPRRRSGPGGQISTISNGQRIDFQNRLAPGKLTLVVFMTSDNKDWQAQQQGLQKLIRETPNTQLLIINIRNEGSPVAMQYTVLAASLPKYILYRGKQVIDNNIQSIARVLQTAHTQAQKR